MSACLTGKIHTLTYQANVCPNFARDKSLRVEGCPTGFYRNLWADWQIQPGIDKAPVQALRIQMMTWLQVEFVDHHWITITINVVQ